MRTLFDLPMSVVHSASLLGKFKPQVVIGVGGYASGPAMLAAALKGIPSLIFEPNLIPGFTNRMAAVMATEAAVQFEQTGSYFRKATVTGVPVREAFFRNSDAAAEPGSDAVGVRRKPGVAGDQSAR